MKMNALEWYKKNMRNIIENGECFNGGRIFIQDNKTKSSEEDLNWLFNKYTPQLYEVAEVIDDITFTAEGTLTHYLTLYIDEKEKE